MNEFQESSQGSQDSMREDSFVSSTGPDQFSDTAIFSCSPPTPSRDQPQQPALSDSELAPTPPEQPAWSEEEVEENPVKGSPPEACCSAPSPTGKTAEDACTAAPEQVSEVGQECQDVQLSTSMSKTSSESLPVRMFRNISHV